MNKYKKLIAIGMLMMFLMACNLLNLVNNASDTNTQTIEQASGDQESENLPVSPESSNLTTDGGDETKDPFMILIPTDVKSDDGSLDDTLDVSQRITLYDSTLDKYKTYFVFNNTASDSADTISEFTFKITWFDKDNQIVAKQEGIFRDTVILPQEKVLFYAFPQGGEMTDQKIVSVLCEISGLKTYKMTVDAELSTKISGLPITHPIVSVTPGDLTFEYYTYIISKIPRAIASVTVQSSLTVETGVEVVGLYQNAEGILIGVGKSEPFIMDPGGTASADVIGYDISEQPVKAEYFTQIVTPFDTFDVAFPDLYN